jgi:meso-butanediol dehydrogenase/(S,S)-butanediol dehydrogenase/diacetyl reductase
VRAAIVTGATSGIGRAAALALAEDGWWVLASGRDADRGAQVATELGGRGDFAAAELAEPEAPAALVERATDRDRRLGVVVNNAAIHFLGTLDELGDAEYEELMAINVGAAVRLAREGVRSMRAAGEGGVIVNVASEAGLRAIPNQVAYNVSKAALVMLTRAIAADHAAEGIRAVSICPGTTRTPLVERAIASAEDPAAHLKQLASSRPMGRLGTPEEMAAAIVFAASERASFITGTELIVDGGFTAT